MSEDLLRLAKEQADDVELQNLLANYSGTKMELISRPIDQTDLKLVGEIGHTGTFRPFVTKTCVTTSGLKFMTPYTKEYGGQLSWFPKSIFGPL